MFRLYYDVTRTERIKRQMESKGERTLRGESWKFFVFWEIVEAIEETMIIRGLFQVRVLKYVFRADGGHFER